MKPEYLPPIVIRLGTSGPGPERPVERMTDLAQQLIALFALTDRCPLGGRLTRLDAPDNLTAVRQWLAQAKPDLLLRAPTPKEWKALLTRFSEALRAL